MYVYKFPRDKLPQNIINHEKIEIIENETLKFGFFAKKVPQLAKDYRKLFIFADVLTDDTDDTYFWECDQNQLSNYI